MYIYAETAFHHEGDLDYLKQLIDAAKCSGAHGIKFQVLTDTDYLVSRKHSQYHKFKSITLSASDWKVAFEHTLKSGLDIVMMPIDPLAFRLTEEYDVKYLELHSVSFNDRDVLHAMRETHLPVILGVGGRTVGEINEKLKFFNDQLQVLMVGFQSFPSKLADIKLEKIRWLRENYPSLEIGYADHSSYDDFDSVRSNAWAYILGARFFEKHLTLHEGKQRVDFDSAVAPKKFRVMVEELRYLHEEVLNKPLDSLNELNSKEMNYRNRERVIVSKRSLSKGEILQDDHLIFKMTDVEGGITNMEDILGRKLAENLEEGDVVNSKTVL